MGPYKRPSHAYEGDVEYPSAESFRSRISSHRVLSHTTRSQDDGSGMATLQEQRMRVIETSVQYTSYTTDPYTSSREAVGLQAHHPTRSNRPDPAERHPTLQELQMTPITRVVSSSGTHQELPRPQTARRVSDLRRAQADNLAIEAAERATASRTWPGTLWQQRRRREVRCPPPRYEESSRRSEYLPRLYAGFLRHELGSTFEDNMRGFLAGMSLGHRPNVAEMLRADSMGISNEALVRRILISFNVMPPKNEDADPVPTYEELWEERYDEQFGWAIVPAYEA